MTDTPQYTYLRESDFATKLTPGRGMPSVSSRPDEIALWHLANRTLLVDTEAGVICRANGTTRAETPRPDGYGTVYLGRFGGKVKFAGAHRVVWLAAHGPIVGMYEVGHRNARRWDNRIWNLNMVTHAENMRQMSLQPLRLRLSQFYDSASDSL